MCGIAGILDVDGRGESPSMDLLRSMATALRHRGPDEYGVYRDERVGMVHARLSIIDITTGQQPLSNEDGTLWIVFNGEIFNYVELRSELEGRGHRFRTHSDTEVIVHAYEQWGDECFVRFNGQWAVAVWNSEEHRLVLARDRIGVRPLYICEDGPLVRFGSEVKAIFADPRVRRAISPQGMDQTFTYWTSIAPTTVFEGIQEMPQGSVRTYESGGRRRERVLWRPSFPTDASGRKPLPIREATEELRARLTKATALRMLRSDVPVGSYLSGGLDSSLIASMGRQAKEGRFQTFSIRFTDRDFDETEYQRAMAATIDSDHRELEVSRDDIARVFPDVVRHTERPVLRTAPAPLFLLSQLVRQSGIKAVLTGEGADEMLAGYDIFREAKIRMFWSRQPDSTVRPRLFERLYPYLSRSPQQAKGLALEFWKRGLENAGRPGFTHETRWWTTSLLKRFFHPDVRTALEALPAPDYLATLPEEFSRWDLLSQAQFIEDETLLSGYLISSQGDRMLMAHSVEGRFPFLDAEVMEFCNSLPPEHKLLGLNEKYILKRVAEGVIPETIIRRPKQPYRAPNAVCFLGPDAPAYAAEILSEAAVRTAGVFDPRAVSALVGKGKTRARTSGDEGFSNADNMAVVGIVSTQLLYHLFIEGNGASPGAPVTFSTVVDRAPVPSQQQ